MNRFIVFMAWRNLWRQKRRTCLTLLAIALGLSCLVFFTSLMKGFHKRLISLGTQTMMGEAQIHSQNYVETHDPLLYMEKRQHLIQKIDGWPGVQSVSPRLFSPALVAMGDRAVSVQMLGIDTLREPLISNWQNRLYRGSYLQSTNEVMIGKKLAEKMELEIGGKLVLTVANFHSGELNSQLLEVVGIIWSQNPQLNQSVAIVDISTAEALSGVVDSTNEIVLKFKDLSVKNIHTLFDPLVPDGLELLDWHELLPEIALLLRFQDFFMGLTFFVIVFLVALGMMNTMGMAIIERIREFGVLQALGTLPGIMVKMVMFEFVLMGITGAALGLLLGWGITLLLGFSGIPVDQVEVTGFLLTDPIFPAMDWVRSVTHSVLFCVLVPVFCIIPVRRVTRLDTVRALRFS